MPVSAPEGGKARSGFVLEDLGSTNNFVTRKLAEELGLPSEPLSLTIRVLEDQHRHKQTKVYRLSLKHMLGIRHDIQAIGMNSLTEVTCAPEVRELIKHFPEADHKDTKAFIRAQAKVQVMLGMSSQLLHCGQQLCF